MYKLTKKMILPMSAILIFTLAGCGAEEEVEPGSTFVEYSSLHVISPGNYPPYTGDIYTEMNSNSPQFTYEEVDEEGYETFLELDELGRVQVAQVYITSDMLPEEGADLENTDAVTPTGWQDTKYKKLDINNLYQRVNLISAQFTGHVDHELNILTGTTYMVEEGLKPFEDAIANYIRESGNDVLFRATPKFIDDNLVAHAIQIEAYSLVDQAESIGFNVYVHNVQPGVDIDYATGESKKSAEQE